MFSLIRLPTCILLEIFIQINFAIEQWEPVVLGFIVALKDLLLTEIGHLCQSRIVLGEVVVAYTVELLRSLDIIRRTLMASTAVLAKLEE